MNRLKYGRRRVIPALVLGILAVVFLGQARAQPPTVPAVPDSADNFTGTLLFINGRPQAALPVTIGELRTTCVSRLEAALRGQGHRTADRDIIEDLVKRWRIRASHLIPLEFLTELNRDHQVGQVLVVTLLSDNARFLMTARMIDAGTGRLIQVDLKDVDLPLPEDDGLPTDLVDWRLVLDGVCQEIAPPWVPALRSAGKPMLVLPTRGIASDPEITSFAAHSLLKTLLGQGLSLIDPSLVEVTMLGAGLPSHWLDARGRRLLLDRFASDEILVSELVSYDSNKSFEGLQMYDSELPDSGRRNLTVFSLTMRKVDLHSGNALRFAQVMHENPPATGWFGSPVKTTLLDELETTSFELWAAFRPDPKDD
jgi:hypothetical protein